ncbi:MAG: hypothetical protein JJE45_06605 [Prolixibacteraceae bacterium]|nr:hypothetical protein [Prolixibacteraceae bacterium]
MSLVCDRDAPHKEVLLKKGEILTFRYRFVLADGNLIDEKINKIADEYSDIND